MYVEETLIIIPKEDSKIELNRYFPKDDGLEEEQIAQEPDDEYHQRYCKVPSQEENEDDEIDRLVRQFREAGNQLQDIKQRRSSIYDQVAIEN